MRCQAHDLRCQAHDLRCPGHDARCLSDTRLALPGPRLALPGPRPALPGPRIALPGPRLALPGPRLALPGPRLALPGPLLALPSPGVALPGPRPSVQEICLRAENRRASLEGQAPAWVPRGPRPALPNFWCRRPKVVSSIGNAFFRPRNFRRAENRSARGPTQSKPALEKKHRRGCPSDPGRRCRISGAGVQKWSPPPRTLSSRRAPKPRQPPNLPQAGKALLSQAGDCLLFQAGGRLLFWPGERPLFRAGEHWPPKS